MKLKTILPRAGFAALCLFASGGTPLLRGGQAPPMATLPAGIQTSLQQLRTAFQRHDLEGLLRTYTSDAEVVQEGTVTRGREGLRPLFEFLLGMGIRDFRCEGQECFGGGDTFVETGRIALMDAAGVPLSIHRYMTMWKQSGGQWLIHRDFVVADSTGSKPAQAVETSFWFKQTEPVNVILIPMKGAYRKHSEALAGLAEELQRLQIEPAGPAFGSYYDAPGSVAESEQRWEIGIPVKGTPAVQSPVEWRAVPAQDVVGAIIVGSRETRSRPWKELLVWSKQHGCTPAGPGTEIWLDANTTEMRLPIRRVR